jgi:hypothetical protein
MPGARVPSSGAVVSAAGPLRSPPTARKVLYVNKVASDGWLLARLDPSTLRVPLAKYTQVELIDSRLGRTSFKVIDGAALGKVLSLSDANAREYLGATPPARSLAEITVTYGKYIDDWASVARGQTFKQQMATLDVAGISVQVTMNTVWDGKFTPLPAGEYKVLAPDAPHNQNMTRYYRDTEPSLQFDQVWFPIDHGDRSRYVHVGNVSEGCVTVLGLARWADVHEALISHRAPDGKYVAKLTVKGTPERSK